MQPQRLLEVRLAWLDTALEVRHFSEQEVVTLGDEPAPGRRGAPLPCDLEAPALALPLGRYPLFRRRTDGRYDLVFHHSLSGVLFRPGGVEIPLGAGTSFPPGDLPGSSIVPFEPGDFLWLVHGTLRLEVRYVTRAQYHPPPLLERLNYSWVNTLIVVSAVMTLLVGAFLATPQRTGAFDELLTLRTPRERHISYIPAKPPKKADPIPLPSAPAVQGAVPTASAPPVGPGTPANAKRPPELRGRAKDHAIAESTLRQLFGERDQDRGKIFGDGTLSGGVQNAIGALTPRATAGEGIGGVMLRGDGPDGEDKPRAVPLGAAERPGPGGGGGPKEKLVKTAGNPCVGCGEIDIRRAKSVHLIGGIDKDLIKQVIDNNYEQVRYCYNLELVRTNELVGKVRYEWVIGAEGQVSSVRVEEQSPGMDAVATCVARKIALWRFPKPKGGGEVVVHYPFVFNAR